MDYEQLRNEFAAKYGLLSRRLQQLTRYAISHPNDMALETIAVIAERAEVPPSSLIRFAKSFGFSGFSKMQKVPFIFRWRKSGRNRKWGGVNRKWGGVKKIGFTDRWQI